MSQPSGSVQRSSARQSTMCGRATSSAPPPCLPAPPSAPRSVACPLLHLRPSLAARTQPRPGAPAAQPTPSHTRSRASGIGGQLARRQRRRRRPRGPRRLQGLGARRGPGGALRRAAHPHGAALPHSAAGAPRRRGHPAPHAACRRDARRLGLRPRRRRRPRAREAQAPRLIRSQAAGRRLARAAAGPAQRGTGPCRCARAERGLLQRRAPRGRRPASLGGLLRGLAHYAARRGARRGAARRGTRRGARRARHPRVRRPRQAVRPGRARARVARRACGFGLPLVGRRQGARQEAAQG